MSYDIGFHGSGQKANSQQCRSGMPDYMVMRSDNRKVTSTAVRKVVQPFVAHDLPKDLSHMVDTTIGDGETFSFRVNSNLVGHPGAITIRTRNSAATRKVLRALVSAGFDKIFDEDVEGFITIEDEP